MKLQEVREKGIMDLIMEDSVLGKKFTYDEFFNQNAAAPINDDELLEDAFNAYLQAREE